MSIIQPQPQSILKVIASSFRLYGASFSKIWYWQLLLIGLPMFITSLLTKNLDIQHADLGTYTLLGSVSLLLAFVIFFAYGFIMNQIKNIGTLGYPSVIDSAQLALRKMFYLFAGIFLIYIVLAVLVLPSLVLLSISDLTIALLCFMIFCGIVALFISVSQFPFFPLLLFENLAIFKAIRAGFRLVWGNWWRTFFTSVLFFLIAFLITITLLIIFALTIQFLQIMFHFAATKNIYFQMTSAFLVNSLFLLPVLYAFVIVLYYDLRTRKQL